MKQQCSGAQLQRHCISSVHHLALEGRTLLAEAPAGALQSHERQQAAAMAARHQAAGILQKITSSWKAGGRSEQYWVQGPVPNLSGGPWRGWILARRTGAVRCAPGANPSGLRLLGCWLAMQQQPHCLEAQWEPCFPAWARSAARSGFGA